MSYLEQNTQALEKLKAQYQNQVHPKNLPEAHSDDPMTFGYNLKHVGVVCSVCGGHVTGNNLKFSGFSPSVKCYNCQNI